MNKPEARFSFYVKEPDFDKTKTKIRSLDSLRFDSNPVQSGNTDNLEYHICVSGNANEISELSSYLTSLQIKPIQKKKNFFSGIAEYFKLNNQRKYKNAN